MTSDDTGGWQARATALLQCGDLDGALAVFKELAEIAEASGDASRVVRALGEQSNVLRRMGRLEDGERAAERATALAHQRDDPELLQAALAWQAASLWQLEELDRADALFLEQWQAGRAAGIQTGLRNAFRNLFDLRRTRGDVDGLVALYELAWEARGATAEFERTPKLMATLAKELRNERNVEGSLKVLKAAEQMARDAADADTLDHLLDQRIRTGLSEQNIDAALSLSDEMLRLARDAHLDGGVVNALVMRSMLLCVADDDEAAIASRREALRSAHEAGDLRLLLSALVTFSGWTVTYPGVFALSEDELGEARELAFDLDDPDAYAQLHWPKGRDFSPSRESVVLGVGRTLALEDLRSWRDAAIETEKYRIALFFCQALREGWHGGRLEFDDWFSEGLCHSRVGQHEEAVSAYRRALTLDDSSASAQTALIASLLRTGRISDALALSRAALLREPPLAPPWLDLASTFFDLAGLDPALTARAINALRHSIATTSTLASSELPDPESGELLSMSTLLERNRDLPAMGAEEILAPWERPAGKAPSVLVDISATPCGPMGQPAWAKGWPLWIRLGDERAERLRHDWLGENPGPVLGGELCHDSLLLLLEWQDDLPMGGGGVYPAVGAFNGADAVCALLLYAAIPGTLAGWWGHAGHDFDLLREACSFATLEEISRFRALLESLWQAVQHPDVATARLPQLISEANVLCGAFSPAKVGGCSHGFEVRHCAPAAAIVRIPELIEEMHERADDYEDGEAARLVELVESGAFDEHDAEHRALLLRYFEELYEPQFC